MNAQTLGDTVILTILTWGQHGLDATQAFTIIASTKGKEIMYDFSLFLFILLGIILGYVFAIFWCKTTKSIAHLSKVKGYHLHHTLFIVPAVILAILSSGNLSAFFLFFGIGAMLHDFFVHGALKFITKD